MFLFYLSLLAPQKNTTSQVQILRITSLKEIDYILILHFHFVFVQPLVIIFECRLIGLRLRNMLATSRIGDGDRHRAAAEAAAAAAAEVAGLLFLLPLVEIESSPLGDIKLTLLLASGDRDVLVVILIVSVLPMATEPVV